MKVYMPKDSKYQKLIETIKTFRAVTEEAKHFTMPSEEDIIIPREWSGLTQREFKEFGHLIRVEDGTKQYDEKEIVLTIMRKHIFKMRLAKTEKNLIERAAKLTRKDAADFVRESTLTRAKKIVDATDKRKH